MSEEKNIIWQRVNMPKGLVLRFPGLSLCFNHTGNLTAFSTDSDEAESCPMRLVRQENINGFLHLVFGFVPEGPTGPPADYPVVLGANGPAS